MKTPLLLFSSYLSAFTDPWRRIVI